MAIDWLCQLEEVEPVDTTFRATVNDIRLTFPEH